MSRTTATFSVALVGNAVSPERVPVRTLSEILSAVQSLVSGRDLEADAEEVEPKPEPEAEALSLLDVKKGSAVFPCLSRRPTAVDNLTRVGKFLQKPELVEDDRFAFAMRPTKVLSGVARHLQCRIEIRPAIKSETVFAVIDDTTYARVSESLLVSGETSISGTVQRVGGATEMRCALRVPGRERLLYCDVGSPIVSRKLGEHLYQEVTVSGTATWFQRTWSLYSFRVAEMREVRTASLLDSMKAIYDAGGKGWDSVRSPQDAIRELRS